jgi:hypothetical protein
MRAVPLQPKLLLLLMLRLVSHRYSHTTMQVENQDGRCMVAGWRCPS